MRGVSRKFCSGPIFVNGYGVQRRGDESIRAECTKQQLRIRLGSETVGCGIGQWRTVDIDSLAWLERGCGSNATVVVLLEPGLCLCDPFIYGVTHCNQAT